MLLSRERRPRKYLGFLGLAWEEARPVVQLIFMLRFSVGVLLSASGFGSVVNPTVAVAMVAWLAVTWAIYLLNGVADIVEDRANASARPIASGRLPVEVAVRIVAGLVTFALVLAAAVSVEQFVLVALMFVVGWAYS